MNKVANFKLISDGSCDLGAERAAELDVDIVPFYVSFDGDIYRKEIEDLDIREFYQMMVDHPEQFPKSSMPSVQDYVDHFEPYAAAGEAVLCICITSKFSGSYNAARLAVEQVTEDYPEAQIKVVDARMNTVLQGLFVEEAAKMRDQGLSLQEAYDRLEKIKGSGRIFFTIGNMEYLVHGGRVGKVLKAAGSRLKIRPLITLKEGEIFPSGLAVGRVSSVKKVESLLLSYLEKERTALDHFQMVVGFGYDREEGERFLQHLLLELRGLGYTKKLELRQIGATIGVHTGPHPLGVGLLRVQP